MKQLITFLLLLIVTSSCLKDVENSSNETRAMSVEQYVSWLKSGNFNIWDVPVFEISDIPSLLRHIRNEQLVVVNTTRPESSFHASTIKESLGMVILWIIEGTRLDVDHPSATMTVVDENTGRLIPQNDIALMYEHWWDKNKNKTIAQLKEISPFEGTNFIWQ